MPLGAAYLLAIALGLLPPLIFGGFSRRQEVVLALAEAVCLAAEVARHERRRREFVLVLDGFKEINKR